MRVPTVVLSAVFHVGLAAGLIAVAQQREIKRRAISVAVTEEKKKEAARPKPPPPPPPVVRRAAPKVMAGAAKPEPSIAPRAAAPAPVVTNIAMSNEDTGPGIGLGAPAAGKGGPKAAPAAVKVASAISERRTHRAQEEAAAAGGGGAVPCNEPPTKPQPVVTTEINYSLYPQAQQNGIEGKFRAHIIVGTNGEVTDVEVLTSIDPGFDAAIVAALRRWRFKPAMLCGQPIAGGIWPVNARFELAD